MIHDRLHQWTRIETERHPSPSEAMIDTQSVKSAAGVHQQVGFDGGKLITGRKRFLTVDTLDCLTAWWKENQPNYPELDEWVIDLDGGAATRSDRTQFIKRMVELFHCD